MAIFRLQGFFIASHTGWLQYWPEMEHTCTHRVKCAVTVSRSPQKFPILLQHSRSASGILTQAVWRSCLETRWSACDVNAAVKLVFVSVGWAFVIMQYLVMLQKWLCSVNTAHKANKACKQTKGFTVHILPLGVLIAPWLPVALWFFDQARPTPQLLRRHGTMVKAFSPTF